MFPSLFLYFLVVQMSELYCWKSYLSNCASHFSGKICDDAECVFQQDCSWIGSPARKSFPTEQHYSFASFSQDKNTKKKKDCCTLLQNVGYHCVVGEHKWNHLHSSQKVWVWIYLILPVWFPHSLTQTLSSLVTDFFSLV